MSGAPGPRPEVGPPAAWSFPAPVTGQLSNGLRVVAFDVAGAALAAVSVVVEAPLAQEPRDVEGVATIVANTLDEGTASRSGEQFSDEIATLGADYGASVGRSATFLTLDIATASLRPGLELVAEALTAPAFPPGEVTRHVALQLAAIAQQDSVAAVRAARGLEAAVFAPSTRASRPGGGTAATVGTITRDDVVAWYGAGFAPARTTVVLAADLGGTDPVELLDGVLGGWSPAPVTELAPARAPESIAPLVTVIDRPGSVQSALALGLAGTDRRSDLWPSLVVAGHALGGGLSSRLMQSLREDLGYTYGISARFSSFRAGGQFAVTTAVDTANTAASLAAIRAVVDGMRDGGLTRRERDDAVDYWLGASPLRFQTARALVDQAAGLVADGMPPDWLNVLRAELPGVTEEAASAAFAETVPAPLAVVVVGDADTVAEPVRALGLDVAVAPADPG